MTWDKEKLSWWKIVHHFIDLQLFLATHWGLGHLRLYSPISVWWAFSFAFWIVVVKIKQEELREYIRIIINNLSMPTLGFCLWITYGSALLWSNYLWGVVKSVIIYICRFVMVKCVAHTDILKTYFCLEEGLQIVVVTVQQ